MDGSPSDDDLFGDMPELKTGRTTAVRDTPELRRIRDMARRHWEGTPAVERLCDALTARFRTETPVPPPQPGEMPIPERLLPAQAVALLEAVRLNGAFVPLVTGGGKTLLSLLLPEALATDRAMLLLPKSLVAKTEAERARLAPYWKIRRMGIYSYQVLPHQKTLILDYDPELLICDEVHALKNRGAARTKIVKQWRDKHPYPTRSMVGMSGSVMARDLRDLAHIVQWCIGDWAPVPRVYAELQEWALAVSEKIPDEGRLAPGALLTLAETDETLPPVLRGRKAFAARFGATRGVITTTTDMPAAGLIIHENRVPTSPAQSALIRKLVQEKQVPDGEPCEQPLDIFRHMRSMAVGLWMHWDPRPPLDWLFARKEIAQGIYQTLTNSHTLFCPMDVINAIDRGKIPELVPVLAAWRAIKPTFEPNTVTEWICDSTLNHAAAWLEKEQGICWVSHVAFGERLSKVTGIPYFRQGAKDPTGLYIEKHKGPAICSVFTCHEGLNLQYSWSKNLLISPVTNKQCEQWISRTHRRNQPEDDVTVEVLLRCEGDEKQWSQAKADARAVTHTMNQPQRLFIATYI